MLQINVDGCLTDPEPDVDSRRATVRNMRSMCRCSCVLQFTFRRAVSCDLHRPPSQVIHCIMLFYLRFSKNEFRDFKKTTVINPYKGRAKLNFGKAEVFQQLGIPSETFKKRLRSRGHCTLLKPAGRTFESFTTQSFSQRSANNRRVVSPR